MSIIIADDFSESEEDEDEPQEEEGEDNTMTYEEYMELQGNKMKNVPALPEARKAETNDSLYSQFFQVLFHIMMFL